MFFKGFSAFVVLSFLVFIFPLKASDVIIVADPWCPYNCGENDRDQGILVNLARDAFAKYGIRVNYKNYPWTRSIALVKSGDVEGLVGVGREEVPELIFPDSPIAQARHSFFVKQESKWRYRGPMSLTSRKLGAVQSYSYGDFREKFIVNNMDIVYFVYGTDPLHQLVKMLEVGRIDTLIAEERVLRNHLLEHAHQMQLKNAGVASVEDIYIGFSPKRAISSSLVRILNEEITDAALKAASEKFFKRIPE